MKIPFLEAVWPLYKDEDRVKSWYPRRIVCPNDYVDPRYYAIIAHCQHEHPALCPQEQLFIGQQLRDNGMPTYFLDGNFMQAVVQTEPVDKPTLAEINLPLHQMMLVLPISVSRQYFCGFDVPYICFAMGPVTNQPGKFAFIFHTVMIPSDGKPLGYYGRIPMADKVDTLSNYDFHDYEAETNSYVRWALRGRPNPNEHIEGTRLPTKDEDLKITDFSFILLYKLFLVLQSGEQIGGRNKFETPAILSREQRGMPDDKKFKQALWNPCFIGKDYKPKVESAGGHHNSPRMHWRRGHTRMQAYGPKMSLRRSIWIQPMLISTAVPMIMEDNNMNDIPYYEGQEMVEEPKQPDNVVNLEEKGAVYQLEDNSPMPFGREHRGKRMDSVPASYLHWCYCNVNPIGPAAMQVIHYIERNISALKKEHPDGIWKKKTL